MRLTHCNQFVLAACMVLWTMCANSNGQNQHSLGKPGPKKEKVATPVESVDEEPAVDDEVAPPAVAPTSEPPETIDSSIGEPQFTSLPAIEPLSLTSDWLSKTEVGYDGGFVVASKEDVDLDAEDDPFSLKVNGWGQLRVAMFESETNRRDQKQFQLQRGRIILSGSAFTNDFSYFLQLDGRSSSGDDIRLLDYFLQYDLGRHLWGWEKGTLGFKSGKYKMPFNLSRYLTAREFEFSDRSVASTFFDVNRSFAWGLAGKYQRTRIPINWEIAIFNGLVTGGAETGSSGDLDNNFAYSARMFLYPTGDWGHHEMADFENRKCLATRIGWGFANTTNSRFGSTEFDSLRVVDSGELLSDVLPMRARQYGVSLYAVDAAMKYRGWSSTFEYYFRTVSNVAGAPIPDLFDHGFWFQLSKFVVPGKVQLISRWSRVVGNSETLGGFDQSSDEVAGGLAIYFNEQNAKTVLDATYINGSPVDSEALGITPGEIGWLIRSQIQFAF